MVTVCLRDDGRTARVAFVVQPSRREAKSSFRVARVPQEKKRQSARSYACAIAASGVDLISAGWLTHSAQVLDIGLDWRRLRRDRSREARPTAVSAQ